MHLDEETLERFHGGELSAPAAVEARAHLERCESCRARAHALARDASDVDEALHALDVALPKVTAEALIARAGRAEPALRRVLRLPRWAAAALLAAGVIGVAYAVPGSPLRAWVDAAIERAGSGGAPEPSPRETGPPSPTPTAVPRDPGGPGVSGVSLEPGEHLLIVLEGFPSEANVLVRSVDGREVVARTTRGTATYALGRDRLVVRAQDPTATIVVEVPEATADRVEIRLGSRRVHPKEPR